MFHLSDLVRTSFLAATSDVLQLRVGGYQALGEVIGLFAHTPDPDYPDHSLLELYQAQVGERRRGAREGGGGGGEGGKEEEEEGREGGVASYPVPISIPISELKSEWK